MQTNLTVSGTKITGTLKNITDGTIWDSGTWGADESTGHFIFLKATDVPEGAVTTVQVYGGKNPPVTLDSDLNCIFRITDKDKQKIVMNVKYNGVSETRTYDLKSLTLAS